MNCGTNQIESKLLFCFFFLLFLQWQAIGPACFYYRLLSCAGNLNRDSNNAEGRQSDPAIELNATIKISLTLQTKSESRHFYFRFFECHHNLSLMRVSGMRNQGKSCEVARALSRMQ
jgi:hypothetical protein